MFPQKDKNTSYNYYQEHIRFWCNLAICWRAFNHCVAFHMLGVSGHCGECKCISSMPNVCCAGNHWFSHKFDNDNYFLFSSRVCLKEQFGIFTTQALLELPKVARSSHGNSFIPGLSPLAGILLNRYCRLTPTCVHLFTVDLYPITCKADTSTEMSCVWNLTDRTMYAHTHKKRYLIPIAVKIFHAASVHFHASTHAALQINLYGHVWRYVRWRFDF